MLVGLRAVNFRCWPELAITLPPAGIILVGDNAQGKTSILEAVCLAQRLQSPRTHKINSLIKYHAPELGVAVDTPHHTRKIKYHTHFNLEVNHEPRPTTADYLRDSGLIVWMGNDDMHIIRGGADLRRRYLDFIGCQWDAQYKTSLSRYKRALKSKNLLLKERTPDHAQICAYEEIMIACASHLADTRSAICESLNSHAAHAHHAISHISEPITIIYKPCGSTNLAASIAQVRDRERLLRTSLVGPHRDDLTLLINQLPAAEYASEGQQRTLALALKLAQGKILEQQTGQIPLYLLDDIFGELDPSRRNALIAYLPPQAQKWITTTSLAWLTPASQSSLTEMKILPIKKINS